MGKYDGWDGHFRELPAGDQEIPLEVLDDLVEGGLPDTAWREKAWWSGEHYYAAWRRYGWYASLQPDLEVVKFSKTPFRRGRPRQLIELAPAPVPAIVLTGGYPNCLILLGCVKTKRQYPAPAKDLYVSALWAKRRRYAESSGQSWAILSAEHGLV